MAVNQAREDLRDKLILERSLLKAVNRINRKMVREVTRTFGISGDTLNANDFKVPVEEMLNKHYEDTANIFDVKLNKQMPEDVAVTSDESEKIESALALYFIARAGDQSQIITDTNQKDINESIIAAQAIAQEETLETGITSSHQEIAVVAGALLARKLTGRAGSISSFETQSAAEISKSTELDVLIGQEPRITSGTLKRDAGVRKEWVTVGDEKVRAAHVAADGQIVDANEPFIVGGEQLMEPSDTSLGASAGNVINCRCSSVPAVAEVIQFRREFILVVEGPILQESA